MRGYSQFSFRISITLAMMSLRTVPTNTGVVCTIYDYPGTEKLNKLINNNDMIYADNTAAMLILRRIKSFVFARQASPRREFSARLAVQKQSFLFS